MPKLATDILQKLFLYENRIAKYFYWKGFTKITKNTKDSFKIIKTHKKLFFEIIISPARLHQFKLDKKLFKQLLPIQSWKRLSLKPVAHKCCFQIPVKFSSKCEKALNYVWVNISTCWIKKNSFASKSFKSGAPELFLQESTHAEVWFQ